jgi:hypothetical protein
MTERNFFGPESIVDFQIGKKILIIDPQGHDISLILKCKKVYREELGSDIDINLLSPGEAKVAQYVMSLDNNPGYLGKVLTPDEFMIDEINETIRNLERTKNEIETRMNKELERYQELRQKVQLHNYVDEFGLNSEEVEVFNLHQKMVQRYPNGKFVETDEEKIIRLKRELSDKYKYTMIKDIPEGKEYDNHRELLRAINRVKKRKQREREKAKINGVSINNIQNTNLLIYPISFPESSNIVTSNGFIMEVSPSGNKPPNESSSTIKEVVTSSGVIIEILQSPESNDLQQLLNSQNTDVLNTSDQMSSQGKMYIENYILYSIPEDYEVYTDPLKILTWFEYYNAEKFVNELEYHNQMNWKDWDFIKQIYMKLARIPSDVKGLKSMREEYLTSAIIEKYRQLGRKLPEINDFISLRNTPKLLVGSNSIEDAKINCPILVNQN